MKTVTELAQEVAPGRTIGEAIDSDFNKCSYRVVCRVMKARIEELERDAARYRCYRVQNPPPKHLDFTTPEERDAFWDSAVSFAADETEKP